MDKSGFNRQLHALTNALLGLFATCDQVLKDLHPEARYVIDSFPVAVCQNGRIRRSKLLTGTAYHGRRVSKGQWISGVKVQVLIASHGVPVEFYAHAGREADSTGLRVMPLNLPAGSRLYPNNAYTAYVLEDVFAEATGRPQLTARQAHGKRFCLPAQRFLIQ